VGCIVENNRLPHWPIRKLDIFTIHGSCM
jgi:hypothetical protein